MLRLFDVHNFIIILGQYYTIINPVNRVVMLMNKSWPSTLKLRLRKLKQFLQSIIAINDKILIYEQSIRPAITYDWGRQPAVRVVILYGPRIKRTISIKTLFEYHRQIMKLI